MSYQSSELKAERSILRSMGLPAVLTTAVGTSHEFHVLPVQDRNGINSGDFRSSRYDKTFETLAEYLPSDWRDSRLTVGGQVLNVIDVSLDEYGQRAAIKAE